MPEGPEVKRCTEVIQDYLDTDMLSEVRLVSGKLQRLGVKNLEKLVLPARITEIFTRGKSIFIRLEGEYSLVSTLGMSGWWYPPSSMISQENIDQAYYSHVINTIDKASKYIRLSLVGNNDRQVNYSDPRNFGNFYVLTHGEFEARRCQFGHDFLNDSPMPFEWHVERVYQRFQSFKGAIGEALLNQTILAGLGNIYRAEVMYLAKISPHRLTKTISKEEITELVRATAIVLSVAYNGRGHMSYPTEVISMFMVAPMGDNIERHLAYGCNIDIFGNPTKSETIGGRTCWWVPNMQR